MRVGGRVSKDESVEGRVTRGKKGRGVGERSVE